jgi:hypothetical protein
VLPLETETKTTMGRVFGFDLKAVFGLHLAGSGQLTVSGACACGLRRKQVQTNVAIAQTKRYTFHYLTTYMNWYLTT